MDINKKRLPSTDLQKLIKPLIFKNSRIELLGSAGLQSQQYYSDYDLYSVVKERLTPEEAYNECIRILDGVGREPNIFLVEYKIQRKDGSKTKFYDDDTLQGAGLFSSIKANSFVSSIDGWVFFKYNKLSMIFSREAMFTRERNFSQLSSNVVLVNSTVGSGLDTFSGSFSILLTVFASTVRVERIKLYGAAFHLTNVFGSTKSDNK